MAPRRSRFRAAAIVAAGLLGLGAAPMQCPSDDRPAMRTEPDAAEECYLLAERFRERGDVGGWRTALEYLIERFPDSRFAARARVDLEDAGVRPRPDGPPAADVPPE
jgi:hypothetical protein